MKMKNHYVLPICFAAAAHGALLFGFTKNPRPLKPLLEKKVGVPFVLRTEEELPKIETSDPSEAAPKPELATPQPYRSPEPPAVEYEGKLTMSPPPISPIGSEDVRTAVGPVIGVEGGLGNRIGANGIITGDLLDKPPHTRFQASPVYPPPARQAGMSGDVLVDFVVDESGRVIDPRVVRSSNAIFEEATLRAVSKWRFEPGRRDGKIVKFRMSVSIVFNLNDGP